MTVSFTPGSPRDHCLSLSNETLSEGRNVERWSSTPGIHFWPPCMQTTGMMCDVYIHTIDATVVCCSPQLQCTARKAMLVCLFKFWESEIEGGTIRRAPARSQAHGERVKNITAESS